MSDNEYKRTQGGGSDPRFKHNYGTPVTSMYDYAKLEEDMVKLAARFGIKPRRSWVEERWVPEAADAYGLGLCMSAACEGCGRTVVSATSKENGTKGWLCGRCRPLSSAGRIDHAAWVAKRGSRVPLKAWPTS